MTARVLSLRLKNLQNKFYELRRNSEQRNNTRRKPRVLCRVYLRDASHHGKGNGLIHTSAVDQITHRPLVAAVQVV